MIQCSSPTTTISRQVDQHGLKDWTSNACSPGIAAPSLQVKLGIESLYRVPQLALCDVVVPREMRLLKPLIPLEEKTLVCPDRL